MTRAQRLSPALFALLLAACAQAPLLEPARLGGPEVVLDGGFAGGPSARVALQAALEGAVPPDYRLLADAVASPVHAWVGADLVRYDVELRQRNASSQYVALNPALEAQVPVNAQGPGAATFQKLQPGAAYRAYVKAMGRKGGAAGTEAIVQLNAQATGDFVDFDFTGENDLASQRERLLRVQLDAVAFAGTGGLHFGSLQPGGYASPGAVSITGEAGSATPTPSPTPAGPVVSSFAVLANPTHLGVNASNELWVGNGSNQAVRYSATGSALGTLDANVNLGLGVGGGTLWYANGSSGAYILFRADPNTGTTLSQLGLSAPGSTRDLAVGPNGHAVLDVSGGFGSIVPALSLYDAAGTNVGSDQNAAVSTRRWLDAAGKVWRLTASGLSFGQGASYASSPTAVPLAASPTGMSFDAQGNAWVSIASLNQVHKLNSVGAFLASHAVGQGPHASAIDGAGNLWVLNDNATVSQVSSAGSVLSTFSVGTTPVAIQARGGHVWVANQGDATVTHITVPQP